MAILILAIFALVIALEATGHVVFRGRLILLRGGRWLLMWWSLACELAEGSSGQSCSTRLGNQVGEQSREPYESAWLSGNFETLYCLKLHKIAFGRPCREVVYARGRGQAGSQRRHQRTRAAHKISNVRRKDS